MSEVEKIEMSPEELLELQETYGADDPDIQEALKLTEAQNAAPPAEEESGEMDLEVPPTDLQEREKGEKTVEAPPAVKGEEEKPGEKPMVPIDTLHYERKRRQELEEEVLRLKMREGAQPLQSSPATPADPTERFLKESPGKIARTLFIQEKGEEPDVYNPDHVVRLQELTSLVTIRQMEAGQMQQRVAAEREAFRNEVVSWAQGITNEPGLEEKSMARYGAMPEGVQKQMLTIAWNRLTAGTAGKEEFDLIRAFHEETRQEMKIPASAPTPKAAITAAMGMPGTSDVKGGGIKTEAALELIEKKLDQGIPLTVEEEKIIKNLE